MAKANVSDTFKRLQNRYRLVVMNDDTYEEVVTFKLSRLSVYIGLSTIFVLLVSLTTAMLVYTPLKYYIPGYGVNRGNKAELQVLKMKTDSLEQALQNNDRYINNIKNVLNGGPATLRDTAVLTLPKQDNSND
jgi:hypothetical protein